MVKFINHFHFRKIPIEPYRYGICSMFVAHNLGGNNGNQRTIAKNIS
jgi:hypothetical protein